MMATWNIILDLNIEFKKKEKDKETLVIFVQKFQKRRKYFPKKKIYHRLPHR